MDGYGRPGIGLLKISDRTFARGLAWAFVAVFVLLGIAPRYRADWALENALVVALAVAWWLKPAEVVPSKVSSVCLFLFLCLHEVGAHYTYAEVPYDVWLEALTGTSLSDLVGLERNHFDRLVHFLYGLLLTYPMREVLLRTSRVRGLWGYLLPIAVSIAGSALFELIEWGAAELFGGDLGIAYLGTQGDVWDAQKDMALAALGAVLAMALTVILGGTSHCEAKVAA
jgi:putative membrane protein